MSGPDRQKKPGMKEYEPLDLSPWCNAGLEALGEGEEAPIGRQTFRGLPFLVGGDTLDSGRCFVALNGSSDSVTIPVGQSAHNIIFAHRLLESKILEGGMVGIRVAEYLVRYAGGEEVRLPVRDRFEIGSFSTDPEEALGAIILLRAPLGALGNQKDSLPPRNAGSWEEAGRRQTELEFYPPQSYYLWAWPNPRPDTAVESVEILPKGPRFIVAAITLGHLDEHPFVRQGRREARITLTDPADAGKPFSVDVEVDRGVSTYTQPLPTATAEEFIGDPLKGWGEAMNKQSSPVYARIAATPSATVKVLQDGAAVDEVRWGDVEKKGVVTTPRTRVELLDRGKNWVHVTVLDDDTGKPVPCRVHFRSPEGIPFQPHGHHDHVNSNLGTWHYDVGGDLRLGQISYAYIDGKCQGWLPRGDVIADVARGYEYEPLRTRVRIEPGQRELTLRIKRWTDMNARGWYSGDPHVHFLSAQGSHTESQGEDLNVVNMLQTQLGNLFTDSEEFTGAPSVSRIGNNIVYVSQENRQHTMGHIILWGLKKPIMPWCSDGPSEAEIGGTMETTLSHWADEAHAQGATVISPHFPTPNGEPATLVATGRLDAVEMIRHTRVNHIEYYRYLNCGYRVPLVGGTDKMSSEVPVGMYRTYVSIPEDQEFNYDNWCQNVARGRTFLSGGPIIHFSVDGHEIGDTVGLSGPGTVEVEAWAESIFPIHTLEIVQDGRVVASTQDPRGARRLELKDRIKIDGHTWLAARCGGPNYFDSLRHHDVWSRGIFAHTSPIYVACGGQWEMFDERAAQYILTMAEGGLAYIDQIAPLHVHGTVTHHHREDDHVAYLRRPFLEARDAIHRRMDRMGIAY